MKPNLIERKLVKNRYEISDTMRTEFTKSMAELPIKANEVLTERGVTQQFHQDCIENPFELKFPDLTKMLGHPSLFASYIITSTKKSRMKKIPHR